MRVGGKRRRLRALMAMDGENHGGRTQRMEAAENRRAGEYDAHGKNQAAVEIDRRPRASEPMSADEYSPMSADEYDGRGKR